MPDGLLNKLLKIDKNIAVPVCTEFLFVGIGSVTHILFSHFSSNRSTNLVLFYAVDCVKFHKLLVYIGKTSRQTGEIAKRDSIFVNG